MPPFVQVICNKCAAMIATTLKYWPNLFCLTIYMCTNNFDLSSICALDIYGRNRYLVYVCIVHAIVVALFITDDLGENTLRSF